MLYVIVCLAAFTASGLTFFSGFGLGTILTPVFALFFPVPVAVAAAAVVHFLNNVFKLFLVGRYADKKVLVGFAVPAIFAAAAGALLLNYFSSMPPLISYHIGSSAHEVTPVKLAVGIMIVVFSIAELRPAVSQKTIDARYVPLGGLLSGFFGGLSGNQGAFRSMFLIKAGLTKEGFIGTGVAAAVIVDTVRLLIYGAGFHTVGSAMFQGEGGIVIAATLAAFAGARIGKQMVGKITYRSLQRIVAIMLVIMGAALAAGIA